MVRVATKPGYDIHHAQVSSRRGTTKRADWQTEMFMHHMWGPRIVNASANPNFAALVRDDRMEGAMAELEALQRASPLGLPLPCFGEYDEAATPTNVTS